VKGRDMLKANNDFLIKEVRVTKVRQEGDK